MTKSEMMKKIEELEKKLKIASDMLVFIDETTTDKETAEDARIALLKIRD